MIRLISINPELPEIAKNLISSENLWLPAQYKKEKFLINAHFQTTECLLFDDLGKIVDGFILTDVRNFLYNGKSFFELLGGKKYSKDGDIVNPIDFNLYNEGK
jgi:hypothetical protein